MTQPACPTATGRDAVRARIMAEAEAQFRHFGYAKTTVADIARALGMSSANVYRFFDSKAAINNAICDRILTAFEQKTADVRARPLSAADRLTAYVVELSAAHRDMLLGEQRMFQLVQAAMEENWPAIHDHILRRRAMVAEIIAEGQAAGEFRTDLTAERLGALFHAALPAFFHPHLLDDHCQAHKDVAAAEMAAFLLAALR